MLDLQPEDPGLASSAAAETLRSRLVRVLPPLLMVVAAVVSGLPTSRQAREGTAAFVGAHHLTLERILREAASPAIRCTLLSWQLNKWPLLHEEGLYSDN